MKILALYLTLSFIFTSHFVASAEVKHSAIKPEPRSGGWIKRHESFNERVAKGNVDLLLIGDSITHGWEGKGKKIWEQVVPGSIRSYHCADYSNLSHGFSSHDDISCKRVKVSISQVLIITSNKKIDIYHLLHEQN